MARGRGGFQKFLACRAAESCLEPGERIGGARFLGRGLEFSAYLVLITLGNRGREVVARVSEERATPKWWAKVRREVAVLGALATRSLPFQTPRVLALREIEQRLVMVQEPCGGFALDGPIAKRTQLGEVIGRAAATIHGLPVDELTGEARDLFETPTAREHTLAWRDQLAAEAPDHLQSALDFVGENLPEDVPGVLLHGDLLPQNFRMDFDDTLSVLDWSNVKVGSPAYDLAIVTRGTRKLLGQGNARNEMLDAYNQATARPVTRRQLGIHEILLRVGFYVQDAARGASEAALAQEASLVKGLVERTRHQPIA